MELQAIINIVTNNRVAFKSLNLKLNEALINWTHLFLMFGNYGLISKINLFKTNIVFSWLPIYNAK